MFNLSCRLSEFLICNVHITACKMQEKSQCLIPCKARKLLRTLAQLLIIQQKDKLMMTLCLSFNQSKLNLKLKIKLISARTSLEAVRVYTPKDTNPSI